jgi:MFS family permease
MGDPEKQAASAAPQGPGWQALVREFLRELFDIRFTTFMATRMLPGVYGFGIVLAGLFTTYLMYQRFMDSLLEGLVWLVLGPLMFFGLVTALRITLEFVLAVFRMAWYVEQVASHTETVSQELPRFGFLRTLLFGEKSTPPKTKPGP